MATLGWPGDAVGSLATHNIRIRSLQP